MRRKQQQQTNHSGLKVIGYVRVSSKQQADDGVSIDRQIEKIKAYCDLKNYPEPVIIKDEGVSGFKSNRDGFKTLTQLCLTHSVDLIIVYDLSRLSRSVKDTLIFMDDVVEKNGVSFVSLLNDIDTTTPCGKAFFTITAVFNQLYRDEISFKTKQAKQHNKHQGFFNGGSIPYGFQVIDQHLTPNPHEQAVIAEMVLYHSRGLSLQKIADYLNIKMIPTKTARGKWYPSTVQSAINSYTPCDDSNNLNLASFSLEADSANYLI